ncbi:hypothetical protein BJ170DRAFT_720601 [Xylariales sp. AK1849]|nr:hypothetical protein BJ170DRAFT_720601 [Xylariales sp. AK1849]
MPDCRYCGEGCSNSCWARHRHEFNCHVRKCFGHSLPSILPAFDHRPTILRPASKRTSSRSPRERRKSVTDRHDFVLAFDSVTSKRFHYPRNPNNDSAHLELTLTYGPAKPGYRYGYDERGDVVSFAVGKTAEDYIPPKQRPTRPVFGEHPRKDDNTIYVEEDQPMRSKSCRDSGRRGGLDRRDSTRGYSSCKERPQPHVGSSQYHGGGSQDRGKSHGGPIRPYEVESPPPSPRVPRAPKPFAAEDDWEIETVIERLGRM